MANIILYTLTYILMGFFIFGTCYGLYIMIRDDRRSEKKRKEELQNKVNE